MKYTKNFLPVLFSMLCLLMATTTHAEKYLFYLHGAIMEGQKGNAKTASGEYEYDQIVKTFKDAGFTVISEIRKSGTGITTYARVVADEINALIRKGVEPSHITVVGASKGAIIAMYVSTYVKNSHVNYVFIAACNSGNFQSFPDIHFYGNILSIYEKSDDIGESCIEFKNKAGSSISHYREVETNTGQGHQFLWRPLRDWTTPVIAWANGKYD